MKFRALLLISLIPVSYILFSLFLIFHKPDLGNFNNEHYKITVEAKYPFDAISLLFGPVEYFLLGENQSAGVDCVIYSYKDKSSKTIELASLYSLDLASDIEPIEFQEMSDDVKISTDSDARLASELFNQSDS